MTSPTRLACAILLAAAVTGAGAANAQPADWSHAQTLNVALTDFAFTPKVLHLHRNTAYRLHLVNSTGKGHDFAAYELFESAQVAPGDKAKIDDGKIEVSKHAAVDVRFIPTRAGTFKVKCTHPLHSMLGMTGEVVVN
jgi:uncharacterized cupredoxin-like copper-binding protein